MHVKSLLYTLFLFLSLFVSRFELSIYLGFYFFKREEVHNNSVKWRANFHFPCKLTASATNGVLDVCRCRVSVRKVK